MPRSKQPDKLNPLADLINNQLQGAKSEVPVTPSILTRQATQAEIDQEACRQHRLDILDPLRPLR